MRGDTVNEHLFGGIDEEAFDEACVALAKGDAGPRHRSVEAGQQAHIDSGIRDQFTVLRAELTAARDEARDARQEMREGRRRIRELEAQVAAVAAPKADEPHEAPNGAGGAEGGLRALQDRLAETQRQLEAVGDTEVVRAQLAESEVELQRLSDLTVRLKAEASDLAKSVTAANTDARVLRGEVEMRDDELRVLRDEVATLRARSDGAELTVAQEKAEQLASELERCSEQIVERDREIDQLREALISAEQRHAEEVTSIVDQFTHA